MVGEAGADLLVGGAGRDLLIGGTGADRIVGNADDDILLAGVYLGGTDGCDLGAVMKEWTRSDKTSEERVNNLKNGTGLNGSVVLNGTSVANDADEDVLLSWYVDRFLTLQGTAFRDPKSFFHRYATLSEAEAVATATAIWDRINLVNLRENILPTRRRADLILKKVESHLVEEVALRRL